MACSAALGEAFHLDAHAMPDGAWVSTERWGKVMADSEKLIPLFGSSWELSTLISLASAVVAVVGFFIALCQYRRAKTWERKRYVAAECERLFHEPVCRAAFSMLDWAKRRICLYPDNPDYAARFVIVDAGMLAVAFIPHNYPGRPRMRQHDAAIRDVFDQFFNRLDLIAQFHKAGLIDLKDLAYPLRYLASSWPAAGI